MRGVVVMGSGEGGGGGEGWWWWSILCTVFALVLQSFVEL